MGRSPPRGSRRMDSAPVKCAECGTEVAPGFNACPTCGRLIHSETLKKLAACKNLNYLSLEKTKVTAAMVITS